MKLIAAFFAIMIFALWIEYRHRCKFSRRGNPYELIDHQREMRKKKERENESR